MTNILQLSSQEKIYALQRLLDKYYTGHEVRKLLQRLIDELQTNKPSSSIEFPAINIYSLFVPELQVWQDDIQAYVNIFTNLLGFPLLATNKPHTFTGSTTFNGKTTEVNNEITSFWETVEQVQQQSGENKLMLTPLEDIKKILEKHDFVTLTDITMDNVDGINARVIASVLKFQDKYVVGYNLENYTVRLIFDFTGTSPRVFFSAYQFADKSDIKTVETQLAALLDRISTAVVEVNQAVASVPKIVTNKTTSESTSYPNSHTDNMFFPTDSSAIIMRGKKCGVPNTFVGVSTKTNMSDSGVYIAADNIYTLMKMYKNQPMEAMVKIKHNNGSSDQQILFYVSYTGGAYSNTKVIMLRHVSRYPTTGAVHSWRIYTNRDNDGEALFQIIFSGTGDVTVPGSVYVDISGNADASSSESLAPPVSSHTSVASGSFERPIISNAVNNNEKRDIVPLAYMSNIMLYTNDSGNLVVYNRDTNKQAILTLS